MYKNLSKSRFILILCVAIFLLVILLAQFIALSVLRTNNRNANNELALKESELEQSTKIISDPTSTKDALRQEGYVYDDEDVTVEE